MNTEEANLNQLVDELDARDVKERRVLTQLMDKYSQQKGKAFALRSEMGYTLEETGQKVRIPSFVIVQTLDWVGKEIKMGSEMPFMQSHLDEKGRLKVDESIAESVKQRAPDWRRQPAIAAYLAHDKRRKFGTIVAVMNPSWVDEPNSPVWGPGDPEPRALKSAYHFTPLDAKGQIGMLDLDDVLIYALDGQHRVMGIKGLQDIQSLGLLQFKNQDGTVKREAAIKKEDFLDSFKLDVADFQGLLSESITVELLPAVLAGETRSESSQRIRSVFITINAYAQSTQKGETILLDESDGFAIVARKAGTLHQLLKGDRVNWKTSTLPQRTRWYTTLDTLKSMATDYLSEVTPELVETWKPKFGKGQVPIRPAEEEVESARQTFFSFLDHLRELPVFRGLEGGDDLDIVRQFPDGQASGKGHLLVRPIGQMILSRAVGGLVREGLSLEAIFEKLGNWDAKDGFAQHTPQSLWYGITYDPAGKMNTRTNETMAARLLAYMVNGAAEEDRHELLEFVVKSRDVEKPDRHVWRDFDGNEQDYDPADPAKDKQLPPPIK
jgi:DGQHR domain-containing protein